MKNIIILIILVIFTSICTSVMVGKYLLEYKKIAVVDLQTIINDYTKTIKDDINRNKKDNIKNFVTKVNISIQQISKENNLIILPKQVVLGGEDVDLTNYFREVLLYEK